MGYKERTFIPLSRKTRGILKALCKEEKKSYDEMILELCSEWKSGIEFV